METVWAWHHSASSLGRKKNRKKIKMKLGRRQGCAKPCFHAMFGDPPRRVLFIGFTGSSALDGGGWSKAVFIVRGKTNAALKENRYVFFVWRRSEREGGGGWKEGSGVGNQGAAGGRLARRPPTLAWVMAPTWSALWPDNQSIILDSANKDSN